METVSIIVPVCRVEKWLRQCVDSIFRQSFRDFRLILVDDGSPDGCPEICEDYAHRDSRVTVIHQKNRGVSAARNAGLEAARGKYVTFCDGDDFWAEGHLAALVEAAESSGADMVCCNYTAVDAEGNFLGSSDHPPRLLDLKTEEDRVAHILRDVLPGNTGWAVWARLFSAQMLGRGSVRFCESCGNFGEDLNFVLQCCLHARRICSLDTSSYCYRRRPGSAMAMTRDRLNRLNESAFHFFRYFTETASDPALLRQFPLIHFGMLRSGYEALPTAQIPGALGKLARRDWHIRQTRALLRKPRALRAYWGSRWAEGYIFCRFCLHRSVLRYRLERRIYRIFTP